MNTETRRALVIVDVQNDFVEGGALAVTGGTDVASRISAYLAADATADRYDVIVASRDWHTPGDLNGGHFPEAGEEPDYVDTWPVHCVAGTTGADYAPGLVVERVTHHVRKGMGVPAYSAFQGVTDDGTSLAELLGERGIHDVDVCGIATDHCVRATALDALDLGHTVRLLPGLHAGVAPQTTTAAIEELAARGVVISEATA